MKFKLKIGMFFSFVGIIFLIVSFLLISNSLQSIISGEKINATIERIQYEDESNYVYVSYIYQNEEYKNIPLGFYSSSMKKNDIIEIYINPQNPKNINLGIADFIIGIVFFIISGVSIFLGVLILSSWYQLFKETKKIKKEGIKLYLKVIALEQVY